MSSSCCRVICLRVSRSCRTPRIAASPLPIRAVSVSLRRTTRALLDRDRRDARAHEAGAEHAELVHLARRRRRLGDARILLERVAREEQERPAAARRRSSPSRRTAALLSRSPLVDSMRRSRACTASSAASGAGIVAVRLLHDALARLLEHDAAPDRIAARAARSSDRDARRPLATVSVPSASAARAIDRDVAQNRRMHHLIDEAHLQRSLARGCFAR